MSKKIAQSIIDHPDNDEIISRLVCSVPINEINEWLKSKYGNQKGLIISQKSLQVFKSEYLDLYTKIREDLLKTQFNNSEIEEIKEEIQGNAAYKQKLLEMADKELNIKDIVKKLVVSIQFRADQVFEMAMNDPSNLKNEKIIVDWFRLLLETLERFDKISNGTPDNIVVNNNISIQLVDNHIHMIYDIIKEILSGLDYESSLLFTELFAKKLAELKSSEQPALPIEKRLEAAYKIESSVKEQLNS